MLDRQSVRSGMAAFACALLLVACGSTIPSAAPGSIAPAPTPTDVPAVSGQPGASGEDPGPRPRPKWFPGDAVVIKAGALAIHDEADETSPDGGDFKGGDVVRVIDYAKTDVDGRTWLYVVALSSPVRGRLPDLPEILPEPEFAPQGWILAEDGATANVGSLQPRCPRIANFDSVAAMLGFERVACFGSSSLTLDAISGCGPCGGDDGAYEPPWLAGDAGGSMVANQGTGRVALYLPPPLVAPAGGTLIRVTGHFDDPRAAGCRVTLDGVELPHFETVEMCRRHFVVQAIQVLPTPAPNPLE
ncbi:MAG TPA: hypothetical protein VJ850_03535 [Candidatus Limnocylindrales bacterium]|nr:hypothetical protein [Candidatus Limnocylindrales bacterium]